MFIFGFRPVYITQARLTNCRIRRYDELSCSLVRFRLFLLFFFGGREDNLLSIIFLLLLLFLLCRQFFFSLHINPLPTSILNPCIMMAIWVILALFFIFFSSNNSTKILFVFEILILSKIEIKKKTRLLASLGRVCSAFKQLKTSTVEVRLHSS